MQPDLSLTTRSRKSLSLDNLHTVGDESPFEEPGNLHTVGDESPFEEPGVPSQSVMYARYMNQSFRVAVDKSFDGPPLATSLTGWC